MIKSIQKSPIQRKTIRQQKPFFYTTEIYFSDRIGKKDLNNRDGG
jgi:hypothetical protein